MGLDARLAAAAILVLGLCATVAISWPGHLSYDSIVQLNDGRNGFYHSWHPPVMAWLLGLGDNLLTGTGLFLAFDATLGFAALFAILWLGPVRSWSAVVAALVLVALPQLVLYQAIVWKDVLFADAAVAAFVALAFAEAQWKHTARRLLWLALAAAFLVLVVLARQNGAVLIPFAAVATATPAWRNKGRRMGLAYGAGLIAIVAALSLAAAAAFDKHSDHGQGPRAQLMVLRLYDLIGALKHEPAMPLARLDEDAPELARLMRSDGIRLYTPQRNDTLVGSQALQDELGDVPPELLAAQWDDLILHRPWLYLRTRASVFAWVFFTPDLSACRPVFTGIEGPAGEMQDLGLSPRMDGRDRALAAYAKTFQGTPAFSHAAFALIGLLAALVLFKRKRPGDTALAWLVLGALGFAASFFAIAIACDYRYLYALDLAALAAVFAVACDPGYLFQVVAMWLGSFWLARSEARKS
ncbi:MAG: hypothetical protein JOZ13_16445 [Alphaproteobacteria bacterium]|nr:hypothetical protein [Alphaproteobacteria bacterium]